MKLPDFWTTNLEIWLYQAGAQFALRHIISDETKYYYVLAALDQNSAQRLLDLWSDPPAAGKYTALGAETMLFLVCKLILGLYTACFNG